ncbi:unnamed protein product [Tuber aestivum]|uniref:HD domain-containing protein n=1 Tax=Tuber aestivum TaxID=59557 RepID=A0A292PK09_9PEZI|nr:unnamed protein product [Tuber aestivum]
MMALTLAEHSNEPVDILKVLKMLLIHDLVEIDSGDVFLYDTIVNHDNTEAERKAAERIFGLLPTKQAEEFVAIWEEFETGDTAEARFARSMDRFEPILQNVSNQGGTWTEHNVPYDTVMDKTRKIEHGSKTIWDFTETLIDDSVLKGYIKKTDQE